MSQCTLFSNHGHVLLVLADDPEARLRDVAERIGITERAVQKIVRDLQDDGLLTISKQGRRNRYRIHLRKALYHPLEAHRTVGHLIAMMKGGARVAKDEQNVTPASPVAAPSPAPPVRKAKAEPATTEPPAKTPVKPAEPKPAESKPAESKPSEPKPRAARKKKPAPPGSDQQGSLF